MGRKGVTAGHGGSDPGTIGITGQPEWKTNRNVADHLIELLEASGDQVFDPNPHNKTIRSDARADAINRWGADLYIDIHHNAGGGDGAEVFYQMHNPRSKRLAELIIEELKTVNNSRGIKTKESKKYPGKDYHATTAISKCPAVIVETAFLDNKNDIKAVDTLTEQKAEAAAIYRAIKRYEKEVRAKLI